MQKASQLLETLCLEFANTVHWHASKQPMETLHSYADLLTWAEQADIITKLVVLDLNEAAQTQAEAAATVFGRALELREAIYRVLVARVHEQAPSNNDLACINRELALALPHLQITLAEEGFVWAWIGDEARLDAVIWPIVRSVAELLTSAELLPRVGHCADDRGCGWLFLDLSKNHSRRWCDINDCGNRAKQRRHYAKTRGNDKETRRGGNKVTR